MAQIFPPQSNWLARSLLIAIFVIPVLFLSLAGALDRSQYVTGVDQYVDQPVPFSHEHHVTGLGIDCRYCHTQVERAAVASLPTTEVCMTCHSQIWREAPILKPVHDAYESGQQIHWQKVTKLPQFVYFDHSIHIQKGVECASCHGDVGSMSLTQLRHPMTMEFCLSCHRAPERYGAQKKVDCITCHR